MIIKIEIMVDAKCSVGSFNKLLHIFGMVLLPVLFIITILYFIYVKYHKIEKMKEAFSTTQCLYASDIHSTNTSTPLRQCTVYFSDIRNTKGNDIDTTKKEACDNALIKDPSNILLIE